MAFPVTRDAGPFAGRATVWKDPVLRLNYWGCFLSNHPNIGLVKCWGVYFLVESGETLGFGEHNSLLCFAGYKWLIDNQRVKAVVVCLHAAPVGPFVNVGQGWLVEERKVLFATNSDSDKQWGLSNNARLCVFNWIWENTCMWLSPNEAETACRPMVPALRPSKTSRQLWAVDSWLSVV